MRRHVMWLGVLALLLGGCGGEPDAAPAPTPGVSTSPSEPVATSRAATPSATPAAWEIESEDGAVAFVLHWVDVFNQATATGDTSALAAISGPACKTCNNFIDITRRIYDSGGSVESDGWTTGDVSVTPNLAKSQPQVAVRIRRPPQRVRENGQVTKYPGGGITLTARLTWQGHWIMKSFVEYQ